MTDKTFTLYWRTGTREVVTGKDTADAMTRAGYGGGATRALQVGMPSRMPVKAGEFDGGAK